jgi:hypothetical protein
MAPTPPADTDARVSKAKTAATRASTLRILMVWCGCVVGVVGFVSRDVKVVGVLEI